jgi:uncharacterized iron-regulated membrane protein
MTSAEQMPTPKRLWPDYRAVWRWHFYAGLFCIPFVIVLSISGAIYLFKPQIEAWNDRAYDNLKTTTGDRNAADQVRAALAAVPGATFQAYELPPSENAAVRVIVRRRGESIRVYVHPETLQALHTVPENRRLMKQVFRLHGELLLGNRGSMLVELAASWTIIMIVTGLYLFWPRHVKGLGGILYPRLFGGARMFWRDLHGVSGAWISLLALFLLLSGLPWAKFWGDYFKAARRLTGTAVAKQDWTNGSERNAPRAGEGEADEHAGHGGRWATQPGGRRGDRVQEPLDYAAVDRIAATLRPLALPQPVVIAPPSRGAEHWTAKSMTPNRPQRVNLVVNPATGAIVSREDFRDRHLIDRIVGVGIAAHEGQLFGWPNQLLGLMTAMGLVLLSVSGIVMWLRRRDQGVLGTPKPGLSPRVAWGLITLVVVLGVYLPLFGISLVAVFLVEKVILSRIPPIRDWLGLAVHRSNAAL